MGGAERDERRSPAHTSLTQHFARSLKEDTAF